MVATLHHLPLRSALERFRELLQPSGVLVIIGLYWKVTIFDNVLAAVALPTSWIVRSIVGQAVGAPLREPEESLREVREQLHSSLPGGTFRRRLFFRYTFVWRRP